MKLKLVSAEPTEDMERAAVKLPNVMSIGDEWQAMWSAAPTDATEKLIAVLQLARGRLVTGNASDYELAGRIHNLLKELSSD